MLKKDRSKFTMKGFSPFNMGTPYKATDDKKKLESTKETKLLQKNNETMQEFHSRLKKLGFNKQASEVKAKMDEAYEKADWDKE